MLLQLEFMDQSGNLYREKVLQICTWVFVKNLISTCPGRLQQAKQETTISALEAEQFLKTIWLRDI